MNQELKAFMKFLMYHGIVPEGMNHDVIINSFIEMENSQHDIVEANNHPVTGDIRPVKNFDYDLVSKIRDAV